MGPQITISQQLDKRLENFTSVAVITTKGRHQCPYSVLLALSPMTGKEGRVQITSLIATCCNCWANKNFVPQCHWLKLHYHLAS